MKLPLLIFALYLCLSLSLTGCGNCTEADQPRPADALEPNDTPETATLLTASLEASTNPREVDVYRFEAQANQNLTLKIDQLEGGNYDSKYTLKVVGTNGFGAEKSDIQRLELAFRTTQAGPYFATLSELSNVPADCVVCICRTRGSVYRLSLTR